MLTFVLKAIEQKIQLMNLEQPQCTRSDGMEQMGGKFLRQLLLALCCFAILLFFFCPSWIALTTGHRLLELPGCIDIRRGLSVLWQIDHLGQPVPDELHAVIQWRLFFPLLGHIFFLPKPVFCALAPVGNLAVFLAIIYLLRNRRVGWVETGLCTTILGAGTWFFASNGWLCYFDSWVVLALFCLVFSDRCWLLWIACLVTPWIDERFVIAVPLALFCRYSYGCDRSKKLEFGRTFVFEFVVPLVLLACFVVVRLFVLARFSADAATAGGYLATQNNFGVPFVRILFGMWEGLRTGWAFVILALFVLRLSKLRLCLLFLGICTTVLVGLFSAQDYGRSMFMLWPVAAYGMVRILEMSPVWTGRLLWLAASITLLLPAYHVINSTESPIYSFYHRLALLQNPSGIFSADRWELSVFRAIVQNDKMKAATALSLANKLSENPAELTRRMGRLRVRLGRWDEARLNFADLTKIEPDKYENWYLLAQADLALGDHTAALSNLQNCLRLAPAGFEQVPEAARFIVRLKQEGDLKEKSPKQSLVPLHQ